MNGLTEAKNFYLSYGRDMIHRLFPEYEGRIAVGLVGHGSECLGFDDETSRDHDFSGGFCMFLTDEDDVSIGVPLARAYNALVREHGKLPENKSALGGNAHGVTTIRQFYSRYVGAADVPTGKDWLYLPSYALCEATNGEVFRDDLGEFSRIREVILHGMPEDVRRKKIAARLLTMAQSGQYNFARCRAHGEEGAAALALGRFCEATVETLFLLERRHAPYYKWCFRAARALSLCGTAAETERLLCGVADPEDAIERICKQVADTLRAEGLSPLAENFLEPHAFYIQQSITDRELRTMHILEG